MFYGDFYVFLAEIVAYFRTSQVSQRAIPAPVDIELAPVAFKRGQWRNGAL